MIIKYEDLKKLLEVQEKIIKSSKMQDANISELLETQKGTLKLIEGTQELLTRSINKQSNEMDSLKISISNEMESLKDMVNFYLDSLKDMMNFYFKLLVFYILILFIMFSACSIH